MFYRYLLLATALLTAACSSKQEGPPPRYAVLRFENLTPDRSLNWVGHAVSEVLIEQIGAIPSKAISSVDESFGRRATGAPGVSAEWSDALLAGANRIITGYVEKVNGKLRFTSVEQDARTGRTVQATTVEGSVLQVCARLAKTYTSTPKPYSTRSETALRDFIQAVETGGAGGLYASAVAADPKFAPAYLAWSETALAHGHAPVVQHVLEEARANHINDAALAKLEFAVATVNKDSAARKTALQRIVATDPADIGAIRALADANMVPGHFLEAAAVLAKGAAPERPDLFNLEAYAFLYGGDEKNALKAVHDYQRASPQDPNALDTEGDIQYFFGHFTEAEKMYLAAAAKDPQFNMGTETLKAARAHLMTGDIPGAKQLFSRFQADREKAKDISLPFQSAYWQFVMGDRTGGLAAMLKVATEATNIGLKSLALTQAAIWELQLGLNTEAIRDTEASLKLQQSQMLIPAAIVRFACSASGGAHETEARADKAFNGTAGVAFRGPAVAYALFYSRHYPEAARAWKEIYLRSSPTDPTATFLYAGSLQESGQATEAASLLKHTPPPPTTLIPRFESLYFPKILEWRGDHAMFIKLSGNTAAPAK